MELNEKARKINEIFAQMENTRDLMIDFIKNYTGKECNIVVTNYYDEPVYAVLGIKKKGDNYVVCTNDNYDGYEENNIELFTANELFQIVNGIA